MPGFMFLNKSGQRVDARDYHNRTNHSEGAKLGRDVLQGFWGRKKRQKTGRCARSSSTRQNARLAQPAVFQHRFNLRIVSAPLAIKFC